MVETILSHTHTILSSHAQAMPWLRRRPRFDPSAYDSIIDGVKNIYRDKVRPLEEQYLVHEFHYPLLTDDDFDAKPMVLLIGSYSTGKTSFIQYLLDRDYPGAHVGPEPTTDRFQAVMFGPDDRELPGHTLVSNPHSPFRALSQFGNHFLSRFQGCEVPSDFAKACTLIDTPGILAGKKQTVDRQYSFEDVIKWFAPRVDMILLMFDAHKIDIADELKHVIQHLEGYDDKIRVVLNKADGLEPSNLLKVTQHLPGPSHACIPLHTDTQIYRCTVTHVRTYTRHTHTHTFTHMHTQIYRYTVTHVHTYTRHAHTCTHAHTRTRTRTHAHSLTHARTHARMHTGELGARLVPRPHPASARGAAHLCRLLLEPAPPALFPRGHVRSGGLGVVL